MNLPTVTKPAGTPWTLTYLPSLGQGTLSPIQCTPHVEFPAFPPAPLPTIPDSNWIKGNLSTKKNNKPIKLFVLKKNIISIIFPFQNILPEYRTLENHVNSDAIPCTMRDWCSCASSASASLALLTPSQVDITHWIPEHSTPQLQTPDSWNCKYPTDYFG